MGRVVPRWGLGGGAAPLPHIEGVAPAVPVLWAGWRRKERRHCPALLWRRWHLPGLFLGAGRRADAGHESVWSSQ